MSLVGRIATDPRGFTTRALTDPTAALFEFNRMYHSRNTGRQYDPAGFDLFAEDWDNCLILDACRHDYYERQTPFDSPVERRTSRGSATKQFVAGNFGGRSLLDTVYVSSNWHLWHMWGDLDCEIHRAVRLPHDEGATTRPETVVDAAIDAAAEHPEKRLLVHFMQPHRPYLGIGSEFDYSGRNVRETTKLSDITDEYLGAAYSDNLRLVLDEVQSLVAALDGKTVVTADHGELLGERATPIPVKWYGHPYAVYVPELTTVPWQVAKTGPRREITSGAPGRIDTDVGDAVQQNLRNLGYVAD